MKKDINEMIAVMQAYRDGKRVEFRDAYKKVWRDVDEPSWDWDKSDYRVKPELKLVPYESAEEFFAAQKEHGPYLVDKGGLYAIPTVVTNDGLGPFGDWASLTWFNLAKCCIWQDGTLCGKEVTE